MLPTRVGEVLGDSFELVLTAPKDTPVLWAICPQQRCVLGSIVAGAMRAVAGAQAWSGDVR